MQALRNPRPERVERSAQIIPFAEMNRARSMRVLAREPGAPTEAHPWAYMFPRPAAGETERS
jgi:hypothetical protein